MDTMAVGSGVQYVDAKAGARRGRRDRAATELLRGDRRPRLCTALWPTNLARMLIVAFDPVAAGLLKTPGQCGADVVVGEGQPFGTPMSFGGPYLGLFACRAEHVRKLPGRLVGESNDAEGRRAYVTTLRTREQDIRREKATSNVCTNQTLIAVTAAIQMAWLGTDGLREMALAVCPGHSLFARAVGRSRRRD